VHAIRISFPVFSRSNKTPCNASVSRIPLPLRSMIIGESAVWQRQSGGPNQYQPSRFSHCSCASGSQSPAHCARALKPTERHKPVTNIRSHIDFMRFISISLFRNERLIMLLAWNLQELLPWASQTSDPPERVPGFGPD